jgi:zinc and cadmium transporter
MTLIAILMGTLTAGIGSVWLAAFLSFGVLARYTQHMLSLAAGALLATAFMHLLPEAFESQASAHDLFATLLVGLVFFFLLDKAELWHHGHEHGGGHDHGHLHHHTGEHSAAGKVGVPSSSAGAAGPALPDRRRSAPPGGSEPHAVGSVGAPSAQAGAAGPALPDRRRSAPSGGSAVREATSVGAPSSGGWAVLAGDSVHAFGDGILIASAFMADLRLGVVAALAVLVHEVPHHMGDLVVLRQTSSNRRAAIVKVSLAGAVTALGGIIGYALVDQLYDYLPFFLIMASSSFIYVALADLIPQLQKRVTARETAAQIAWLAIGIGMVTLISGIAHQH